MGHNYLHNNGFQSSSSSPFKLFLVFKYTMPTRKRIFIIEEQYKYKEDASLSDLTISVNYTPLTECRKNGAGF